MEDNGRIALRKGTWTKEEDILLKNCIDKYGEGNWHKVPIRAGLNRCRKSCRLRWLNYLRPNLKRGYFTKDEVDLILRLHKLLGNRWSLIAGRLPGRTANDVKNFWNTHIVKKTSTSTSTCKEKTLLKSINKNNIIKPRPRTVILSEHNLVGSGRVIFKERRFTTTETVSKINEINAEKRDKAKPSSLSQKEQSIGTDGAENRIDNGFSTLSDVDVDVDECLQWWNNLLEVAENGEEMAFLFSNVG